MAGILERGSDRRRRCGIVVIIAQEHPGHAPLSRSHRACKQRVEQAEHRSSVDRPVPCCLRV
jgi:hypothetical protein